MAIDLTRSVGTVTYQMHFDARALPDAANNAARDTLAELADEIEPYLVATLHRWGNADPTYRHMADLSYARVEQVPGGWLLHAGSTSGHAWWHEVRYHPQLRETLDRFGPLIGPRLEMHL